jgi:hypothetical protein
MNTIEAVTLKDIIQTPRPEDLLSGEETGLLATTVAAAQTRLGIYLERPVVIFDQGDHAFATVLHETIRPLQYLAASSFGSKQERKHARASEWHEALAEHKGNLLLLMQALFAEGFSFSRDTFIFSAFYPLFSYVERSKFDERVVLELIKSGLTAFESGRDYQNKFAIRTEPAPEATPRAEAPQETTA